MQYLEKEMATHSSILDWRIPWTEEPGRLYSPWGHKESDMTEAPILAFNVSVYFMCSRLIHVAVSEPYSFFKIVYQLLIVLGLGC